MNIGRSIRLQKCFNNSPLVAPAVRISTILFSAARTKLNFGLQGIKAILSESDFSIKLVNFVNSFSLALDLSLNPKLQNPHRIKFLLADFSELSLLLEKEKVLHP